MLSFLKLSSIVLLTVSSVLAQDNNFVMNFQAEKTVTVQEVSEFPFKIKDLSSVYKFTQEGWVFTVDQEINIRTKLLESQYLEKQLNIYQQNEKLLQEKLVLQEEISDKYRKALLKSEEDLVKVLANRSRTKFWYFVLGVGVTIAAGTTMGYVASGM